MHVVAPAATVPHSRALPCAAAPTLHSDKRRVYAPPLLPSLQMHLERRLSMLTPDEGLVHERNSRVVELVREAAAPLADWPATHARMTQVGCAAARCWCCCCRLWGGAEVHESTAGWWTRSGERRCCWRAAAGCGGGRLACLPPCLTLSDPPARLWAASGAGLPRVVPGGLQLRGGGAH